MTAPMVDYKSHWLKMVSVPESRAVVGRHDGINGRDNLEPRDSVPCKRPPGSKPLADLIETEGFTAEVLHMACFVGFLALKSGW